MGLFEVMLGVDYAARDTGRRIHMRVRETDTLSAAIKAEELADARLAEPAAYTHAMRVRRVQGRRPRPAVAMPLPLAA